MARSKHTLRAPRRHPADVTADRLLDHVERWHDKMSPAERDDLSRVRFVLQQIADGERDDDRSRMPAQRRDPR